MPITKTAVFIASRFEEFAALRAQLKTRIANKAGFNLEPIDLNDGSVKHRPPLEECLAQVRRSDIMILLVGDTYGGLAPDSAKSFTHLEYEEAIRGDRVRVLVYGIGECYRNKRMAPVAEPALAAWQKVLDQRHTMGLFPPDFPVDELARIIVDDHLARAVYEMKPESQAEAAAEDNWGGVLDEADLDDSDITREEQAYARGRGIPLADERSRFPDTYNALLQPAAVAALEQRKEAQKAIGMGEIPTAVKHLERAIEQKPLDVLSNYWLARIYIAQGRKDRAGKAMELAERAAKAARYEDNDIRASACYCTAAKAAGLQGNGDTAIKYARQAIEVAPRFSMPYIELARQYLAVGKSELAMREVERAFYIYRGSLRYIRADPESFRPIRRQIDQMVKQYEDNLIKEAIKLLRLEQEIAQIAGNVAAIIPESAELGDWIALARESVNRQLEWVGGLARKAQRQTWALTQSNDPIPETPPPLPPQPDPAFTKTGWSLPGTREIAMSLLSFFFGLGLAQSSSVFLGWLLFLAAVWLLWKGATSRNNYAAVKKQRQASAARAYEEAAARQAELEACRELQQIAAQALAKFETVALPNPSRLLPFASPYNAKPGSLMRASLNKAREVASESKGKVIVRDQLPFWLSDPVTENDELITRLYYVVSSSGGGYELSRWQAYLKP